MFEMRIKVIYYIQSPMEKISIEKNSVYGLRDKTMTATGSVTLTPSSMVLLLGLECTVDIYMKAKYHNKKRIRKKYQKKIDKGSFL